MIKFIGKNEFALSRYKELYLETIELMKNSSEEDFDFEKMSEIYMIIDEEAKSKQSDVKLKKDFALDMDKVIAFEDKNLKSRLLKQLEKSEDEEIKVKDVISIFHLNLSQGDIKNLRGLEYFLNLESLYLYDNQIEDISAIQNLKNLRSLHLFEIRNAFFI